MSQGQRLRHRRHPNSSDREGGGDGGDDDNNNSGDGMAYGRPARPVISYPTRNNPGGRASLSSYRTKIIVILTFTVLYTAFLYRSGVFALCVCVVTVVEIRLPIVVDLLCFVSF